jgi:hypothetical protein
VPRVEVLRRDVGWRLLAKVAVARDVPTPARAARRVARRVVRFVADAPVVRRGTPVP